MRLNKSAGVARALRWIPMLLAVLLPLHPPAPSAAAGPIAITKPASLSADELTVDNKGTMLIAAGNVVAIYGTLRVTGDMLRLDRPTGIALLAGHVTVTDPRGRASADNVRLTVVGEQRVSQVELWGHVSVASPWGRASADNVRLTVVGEQRVSQVELWGRVSVADPRGKAAADAVTLAVAGGKELSRVQLTGHASIETREYALLAEKIIGDRDADLATADGNVTMYSAPDLIVTGSHATYDQRADHAVVTGDPSRRALVQNRYGRILGMSMEFFRRTGQALVHGPVDAEIYDATLTGDEAAVDLPGQTAVITGHVAISRRQGTLTADRVTIFYRSRRFIAEGQTHMTLNDLEPPASP